MDHIRLGRTALHVSRICLGTLNLGVRTSRAEGQEIMDAALDAGVNFLDTANDYGWQRHRGFTEEFIGDWFALGGGRRERTVLATKVANRMSDWPNDGGLSARHIIASCDDSLRRLRTDWIDLFQMHNVDPTASWDEVWQAMEVLTAQGKVRYVGASNFAGWHLAAAQERAAQRRYLGVASHQCVYNLVARDAEREAVPAAGAYGIATIAWSPLHGGLLGGALRKRSEGTAVKSAQGRAVRALPVVGEALAAFEALCETEGADPAAVALGWLFDKPWLTAAIIGPRTRAHLDAACRALADPLPAELLARAEKVFADVPGGLA